MSIIITPPESAILVSFNGLTIRYYGLIMAVVFLLGVLLSFLFIKKKYNKLEADKIIDYSPFVIFFALIGARLFYVIGMHEFYFKNPLEILLINHGGLSIFGAIVFGIITLYILSKIKKFNFLEHIDAIAVAFPICQAIGRFGNFFNQEAYGSPANGFIKLFVSSEFRRPEYLNIEYYHPAFLYEAILDLFVFLVLLFIYFKNKKMANGSIACLYLVFYTLIRFIIEGIRIDSVLNIGEIPVVRIICIIIFLVAVSGLFLLNNKSAQ